VRFLSREWLERLNQATSASSLAAGASLSVHQRVTGGPDGDVEYTVRLEGGSATVTPGPGPADVEVVQSYDTAAAISQGRLSPAAAFAAGRLRLSGAVDVLVANQEAVAAVGEALAGMPGDTTY
jgi:putative sterol carrier protein